MFGVLSLMTMLMRMTLRLADQAQKHDRGSRFWRRVLVLCGHAFEVIVGVGPVTPFEGDTVMNQSRSFVELSVV